MCHLRLCRGRLGRLAQSGLPRSIALGAVFAACFASVASAEEVARQVAQLQAVHRVGQTFLTFAEVVSPTTPENVTVEQISRLRRELSGEKAVRYRVYRAESPVTSVAGLTPVAEVGPLSCWNVDFYGDTNAAKPAMRYVIEKDRAPLEAGKGLCVVQVPKAGRAYYVVTCSIGGRENIDVGPGNSVGPIDETVGQGQPVLQRVVKPEEFCYVKNPTLYYFVRWESPPNCAEPGRPYDYLVGVPPRPAKPAPVGIHLHCWGGSLEGGYGWWYQAEQGHLLLASNQIPYDWWTGYHEAYWKTPREMDEAKRRALWEQGVVRPYSQTRLLSFLDWLATCHEIDLKRTHVAGNSMGGSGSPMLAIRHPERIAWATSWVGVHTPARSPNFAGSYEQVYGKRDWNVRFEDGTRVWEYFDDAAYLRAHPEREIGLICFSNGKNDGGIGWPQAAEFFRALQETRRPHVFVWGQSGHGQRARLPISLEDRAMPMDLRTDQSQPAFTRGSLDDEPGNGDPSDGDPEGQANLYLAWETGDVVDQADRWEMTVFLVPAAPKDECTVDVTPRRVQQFRLKPGQEVRWSNIALTDGRIVQSGKATADGHALVTLPQARVGKGKNRLQIEK